MEVALPKRRTPKLPDKIFAPVWRLPFVLDPYRVRGRRSKWTGDPPGWLQAAIESGLVEMVPSVPGEPFVCGYLEQIDPDFKVPEITDEEIEAMLVAGLISIEDLPKEDKKEDE